MAATMAYCVGTYHNILDNDILNLSLAFPQHFLSPSSHNTSRGAAALLNRWGETLNNRTHRSVLWTCLQTLREKGKWNVSALEFLLAKFSQTSLTNAVLLAQACWHTSPVSLVTQFSNIREQSIHLLAIYTLFIMLCTCVIRCLTDFMLPSTSPLHCTLGCFIVILI